jgi:crotonobetainyl-CoA:carnitine CoA-transferase CaiB-like acyl-CoA transferase
MQPLADVRIVSLATRLPGPVAVARLCSLGASAVKIEPPEGDPLFHANADWYRELHASVEVRTCNPKEPEGRRQLEELLANGDLLLTASRPSALQRLNLSWPELHARHPELSHIAIVGHAPPDQEQPGHDLTYQARLGLLDPPHLPRVLLADWAGALQVVNTALAVLLARKRGEDSQYAEVRLADAAADFAEPLRRGLTSSQGLLGGAFPGYNLYRAQDGWIAVAALEPQFWQRLAQAIGRPAPTREQCAAFFLTKRAEEWETWGREQDVPIAAVRDRSPAKE